MCVRACLHHASYSSVSAAVMTVGAVVVLGYCMKCGAGNLTSKRQVVCQHVQLLASCQDLHVFPGGIKPAATLLQVLCWALWISDRC